MKKIILVILLMSYSILGLSQKQIDINKNSWWNVSTTAKFTNKISISGLYSWRRYNFVNTWQQSLLRFGLNYRIKDNFTLTSGYDWVVTFPKQNLYNFAEHRLFEQFTIKNKIGRFNIKHRYRLEQRFIENLKLNDDNYYVSNGVRFRQRIRYRLVLTVPLNHSSMIDKTLFLSIFDEIFVNIGKGIAKKPLDQNWLNISMGWKFNSKTSIKIGYQNQYLIKGNGLDIEDNHIFSVSFNHNFDFIK